MKISDLIQRLEEMRGKMGDLRVGMLLREGAGMVATHRIFVVHDVYTCFIEAFRGDFAAYSPQSLNPSIPQSLDLSALGPSPEVPA